MRIRLSRTCIKYCDQLIVVCKEDRSLPDFNFKNCQRINVSHQYGAQLRSPREQKKQKTKVKKRLRNINHLQQPTFESPKRAGVATLNSRTRRNRRKNNFSLINEPSGSLTQAAIWATTARLLTTQSEQGT